MRSHARWLLSLAVLMSGRAALANDAAAAREQLKQGFALKEAGRCEEAIAHFLESERLDPQPKTLINLAECQDKVHLLVEASQNLLTARDMATRPELSTLRDIAVRRLAALEPRLPRLTVTLAPDATGAHLDVLRDGTVLGAVSLGTPLPTNPGRHVVLVRCDGHHDRSYVVTIVEGDQQSVVVTPGEALTPAAPAAVAPPEAEAPRPSGSQPYADQGTPASSARRTIAVAMGGAGVAALATGVVFALVSMNEYGASNGGCNAANQCTRDALASRDHSLQHGDFATGFMAAGAALAAGGAVLWLTAPRQRGSTVGTLGIAPAALALGGALELRGAW